MPRKPFQNAPIPAGRVQLRCGLLFIDPVALAFDLDQAGLLAKTGRGSRSRPERRRSACPVFQRTVGGHHRVFQFVPPHDDLKQACAEAPSPSARWLVRRWDAPSARILDPVELSLKAAAEIYRQLWGVEVFFREHKDVRAKPTQVSRGQECWRGTGLVVADTVDRQVIGSSRTRSTTPDSGRVERERIAAGDP